MEWRKVLSRAVLASAVIAFVIFALVLRGVPEWLGWARDLGLLVLLVASGLFLSLLFSRTDESFDADDRLQSLGGIGVAMLIGGAMFFGSGVFGAGHHGTRDDSRAGRADCTADEKSGCPRHQVLAWRVQFVPGNEACNLRLRFAGSTSTAGVPQPICDADLSIRAVVKAQRECPSLHMKFGRVALPMTKRAKVTDGAFGNIDVCEVSLPASEVKAIEGIAGEHDPIPEGWRNGVQPPRFVVIGDSGCRHDDEQNCDTKWPMRTVAEAARDAARDQNARAIVIHVGDFLYVKADDWETWRRYFFDPAKSLLEAAPWIIARGNHERCGANEGSGGFNYFFGHGPTMTCAAEDELGKTYALDITPKLRLIVAETAVSFTKVGVNPNTSRTPNPPCAANSSDVRSCERIGSVLHNVRALSQQKAELVRENWLITHAPVFGMDWGDDHAGKIPESTALLLNAWRAAPVREVRVIISGDRHRFQVVPAQHGNPLQSSVGTGGVNLDPLPYESTTAGPVEARFTAKQTRGVTEDAGWKGCSYRGFGYLIAEPDAQKDRFRFVGAAVDDIDKKFRPKVVCDGSM